MSLDAATIVHQGNVVGGVMPDISSALGYKEHIGGECINPNGYTVGSYFVGADDGYFYCVTANIAAGDTITVGTNCIQTDVAAEIKKDKADIAQLKTDVASNIITRDVNIGSSFAAGWGYKTTTLPAITGYTPISATIIGNGQYGSLHGVPMWHGSTLVLQFYSTATVTTTVKIRIIYKKN